MQKTIFLDEVLKEMKKLDRLKNPIPFSISVRAFNNQNKTGGRMLHYPNAVLLQAPKTPGAVRLSQKRDFKNPNHWVNRTRNIKTEDGSIKTIHIIFIKMFNGQTVVL